jgi:hypothetical protein
MNNVNTGLFVIDEFGNKGLTFYQIYRSKWGCGGGKINIDDEDVYCGAVREFLEESNLSLFLLENESIYNKLIDQINVLYNNQLIFGTPHIVLQKAYNYFIAMINNKTIHAEMQEYVTNLNSILLNKNAQSVYLIRKTEKYNFYFKMYIVNIPKLTDLYDYIKKTLNYFNILRMLNTCPSIQWIPYLKHPIQHSQEDNSDNLLRKKLFDKDVGLLWSYTEMGDVKKLKIQKILDTDNIISSDYIKYNQLIYEIIKSISSPTNNNIR